MIRLLAGDCRDILPTLPAESVQCVVTSPPYYGLRDYGTALWDGGDAACDHTMPTSFLTSTLGASTGGRSDETHERSIRPRPYRDTCGKCGAVRVDRQIGLEASPDEYLATMVGVFREVRRVLRRDGTCWVNMGDSYVSNVGGGGPGSWARTPAADGIKRNDRSLSMRPDLLRGAAKPKDLLLMPARLALALQADGWWVRSDIIWHKPNPMPESCTDRPTSAHEHVFLLTRSARYFYDADAVREEAEYGASVPRDGAPRGPFQTEGAGGGFISGSRAPGGGGTRNLRNVWTIATHAYPEAHFATFPPELAERCIKAGTSERGCCAACGKPWVRVTERLHGAPGSYGAERETSLSMGMSAPMPNKLGGGQLAALGERFRTTGWAPGCDHNTEVAPCVVLDPFAGAGTTLLVADRLQRDAVGVELNTAYTEMAMERCRADAPLLTSFPPAEPPEDERIADLFAGDEYERRLSVVPERTDAFRNSGRYVNQGPQPSNGVSDMAAD